MKIELFQYIGEYPWRFVTASTLTFFWWALHAFQDNSSNRFAANENEKRNHEIVEARVAILDIIGILAFAIFVFSQSVEVLLHTENITFSQFIENAKTGFSTEPVWLLIFGTVLTLFFVAFVALLIGLGLVVIAFSIGAIIFGILSVFGATIVGGISVAKIFEMAFRKRK